MDLHMPSACAIAVLVALGSTVPAGAQTTMDAEELGPFVQGGTFTGVDPLTGEAQATVTYNADGSSVLRLPDGTREAGTYRFDGDTYCTRYERFRDGVETCFRLEDLGDGRAQAWRSDGPRALILVPES